MTGDAVVRVLQLYQIDVCAAADADLAQGLASVVRFASEAVVVAAYPAEPAPALYEECLMILPCVII